MFTLTPLRNRRVRREAFTLIELLIVIAIILILIAIALPNFLEAQIRAKVARVRAEHRSIETALVSYRTDNPRFPFTDLGLPAPYVRRFAVGGPPVVSLLYELTTPVGYMTSVNFRDPFITNGVIDDYGQATYDYYYANYETFSLVRWGLQDRNGDPLVFEGWGITSFGPDLADGAGVGFPVWTQFYIEQGLPIPGWLYDYGFVYSPTNGTTSRGDISKYMGAPAASNEAAR